MQGKLCVGLDAKDDQHRRISFRDNMSVQDNTINETNDAEEDAWAQLDSELNSWSSSGRIAKFWWRDDDAAAPGPKLDQLIKLSEHAGLLLAVIPTRLQAGLAKSLAQVPHVFVAQHGYAHVNHAPRGQGLGAWELGMHRGMTAVMDDLDEGRRLIHEHFESRFLRVVVPPWNHISSELLEPIAERGYSGVSAFGPRNQRKPMSGLTIINAHCDPIRWKSDPKFRGVTRSITQLIEHLQAKRMGNADSEEATGLLTHHIDLDDMAWAFCERLASVVEKHVAAQWCSPDTLFVARS